MFHPSNKNLLPQCCPAKHRMRRNLTVKSIEGLQPALSGRRYDVADGIVPSFGVRVSDKGKKSYTVTARFPGSANLTRRTIAAVNAIDLAVARETARAWLAQILVDEQKLVQQCREAFADPRNCQIMCCKMRRCKARCHAD
jgi:hypothetical protein